ncbi:GNAT family N-acetyltransferase [Roseomonas xinghualingensis]|uniref:GNAT family N-acetyltransferase n=1 Tax=Roseomonas xinghualingensis TaxID=2986475 RepID=UPI0021F10B70|nr:GNAT family N-acetyltransferase [Roseomonas sp. SXEYE001]MCV4208862.1 GNAT family N-acetyltransferase [Roseomonas sp. SXEYE001]
MSVHPYASRRYAETMAHLGRPCWVEPWGTAMLLRDAPGGAQDVAGLYPLCAIRQGGDLSAGMETLRQSGAVSVVAVADPFTAPGPDHLCGAFDAVRPFKMHWTVERAAGQPDFSRHHRQEIRMAGRRCHIRRGVLEDHLDDWCRLYAGLCRRHGLAGFHAFPRASFAALAEVDGLNVFVAESEAGEIIAMHLWIDDGRIAYSHLAASDMAGYRARAPYGLYAAAIEHFASREAIDLGGGAGLSDAEGDGLAQFKRGFANASRIAHLCGHVLDHTAYARLSAGCGDGSYFPAYRAPG